MPALAIITADTEQIWDRNPGHGPAAAADAYVGEFQELARAWGEEHANRWVLLSPRFGFLDPDEPVTGPDDATFERPDDPLCLNIAEFEEQFSERGLGGYSPITVLGDRHFTRVVRTALEMRFFGNLEAPLEGIRGEKRRLRWLQANT